MIELKRVYKTPVKQIAKEALLKLEAK